MRDMKSLKVIDEMSHQLIQRTLEHPCQLEHKGNVSESYTGWIVPSISCICISAPARGKKPFPTCKFHVRLIEVRTVRSW
jgi:hypothetical protein